MDATALLRAPAARLGSGNGGPRPKVESPIQGIDMSIILGGPGAALPAQSLPESPKKAEKPQDPPDQTIGEPQPITALIVPTIAPAPIH